MVNKSGMFALVLYALSNNINAKAQLSGPFTLTVDLSQTKVSGGIMILYHFNPASGIRYGDTVNITSTTTLFKGALQEPELVNLLIEPTDKRQKISNNKISIYLSPGDIKVIAKDSLPGSTIIGDPLQKDYISLCTRKGTHNTGSPLCPHLIQRTPYGRTDESSTIAAAAGACLSTASNCPKNF
jgi:Domain of unknown function (DUF4369)